MRRVGGGGFSWGESYRNRWPSADAMETPKLAEADPRSGVPRTWWSDQVLYRPVWRRCAGISRLSISRMNHSFPRGVPDPRSPEATDCPVELKVLIWRHDTPSRRNRDGRRARETQCLGANQTRWGVSPDLGMRTSRRSYVRCFRGFAPPPPLTSSPWRSARRRRPPRRPFRRRGGSRSGDAG